MSRYDKRYFAVDRDHVVPLAFTAGALIIGAAFISTKGGPDCSGEQRVAVSAGETVQTMMEQNIDVTDGYVDFNGVSFNVERTQPDGKVKDLGKISAIMPKDTVVMPKTCKE